VLCKDFEAFDLVSFDLRDIFDKGLGLVDVFFDENSDIKAIVVE